MSHGLLRWTLLPLIVVLVALLAAPVSGEATVHSSSLMEKTGGAAIDDRRDTTERDIASQRSGVISPLVERIARECTFGGAVESLSEASGPDAGESGLERLDSAS